METRTAPSISPRFLIFCLVLLTIGFRIVRLSADPPGDFDWSGGYFADEGYWSHNARNAVLFGKAVFDEWDGRVMSPLFTAVQSLVFRSFGVGLAQVRLIGIASALLLTLATFFFIRRVRGDREAFVCAVLVSLNYPLLVLARQGILDPFASALSWTALLFACIGTAPCAFLAGVLLVASCTAKFLMAYAFLPVFAALLLGRGEKKTESNPMNSRATLALAFAVGAAAAASLWFFAVYLPNRDALLAYNRFYASQQAQSWVAGEVMNNIVRQPFFLYAIKTPALLVMGNLMLWFLLTRLRQCNSVERATWLWLVSGISFFALWHYRPLRYYTSMFAPLAALAGLGLFRLEDVAAAMQNRRARIWVVFGLLLPAAQAALVLVDQLGKRHFIPVQLGIHSFDAAAVIALTVVALVVLLFSAANTKWIRAAFIAGFLLCDLRNYTGWMARPEYSALNIAADLKTRLGEHAVISGQWAPELVLENKLKAVPVWKGFVNANDPFRRYGITHLLLWRYPLGDELLKFTEWYPEDMKRFHKIAGYRIKNSALELYQREDVP